MKPVKGHALRYEGRVLSSGGWLRSGPGGGGCECGAQSPDLPSSAARKRWHREHKQAVLDGRVAPWTTGIGTDPNPKTRMSGDA